MSKEVYEIAAKPTYYNRILYRSRLEAKFAAFFDFLRWEYEYEPEPFKTWSPDFIIHSIRSYVEIKPISNWNQQLMDKISPYAGDYRVGLLSEDISIREEAFYIGKYFNTGPEPLILKDFTVQYRGNYNPETVRLMWVEAQNKVMYKKPKF